MREDYTHITVILDRTGSMESIRDDTIGGFNAFLGEQQNESGTATLTLVQFDSQDPYELIHDFKLVGAVQPLTRETYVPRAATPLLDAMGRGINDLEQKLAAMAAENRPAKVVMAIITDGQENASREFTRAQVVKMIGERQEKDNWQFVFLSADLSAVAEAEALGIRKGSAMAYDKNAAGVQASYHAMSGNISDYRQGRKRDASFTDEDRAQQESEQKRK